MRGLTVFVADIRNCSDKEAERKRVEKELAKIRTKFSSTSKLSSYDKKKYVWKLLYAYMLGYDIDFGHIQAVFMLFSEQRSSRDTQVLKHSKRTECWALDWFNLSASAFLAALRAANEALGWTRDWADSWGFWVVFWIQLLFFLGLNGFFWNAYTWNTKYLLMQIFNVKLRTIGNIIKILSSNAFNSFL